MNDQERHKFYKQACSMRKKDDGNLDREVVVGNVDEEAEDARRRPAPCKRWTYLDVGILIKKAFTIGILGLDLCQHFQFVSIPSQSI
ncbi:hypothetical protein HUJ04_007687 [Dendroctonus ponderosae]|nr:hypothetical protein HUJ04_007687 [Dendroctonus ponderosae]